MLKDGCYQGYSIGLSEADIKRFQAAVGRAPKNAAEMALWLFCEKYGRPRPPSHIEVVENAGAILVRQVDTSPEGSS